MVPDSVYPPTGYELSFASFVELLRSGDRSVKRFLSQSYGYSLARSPSASGVTNDRQECIDLAWLHQRIQEDSTQRRELYGIAMGLWR